MTERPNDKAVEAALKAYTDSVDDHYCLEDSIRDAVEAAAPHVNEQFIDGLTDEDCYALFSYAGADIVSEFRRQLKGLIAR